MNERIIRIDIDDGPHAPMQLGNPDTGDFRGYEVNLLKEIGRRVGFALSFRRALWSVIVRELVAGNVDLVCSAATITSERELPPHLKVALAVVKRKGIAAGIAIDGLRLGVRRGTTAEAYAEQHGTLAPTQISESSEKLYASLSAGEFGAVIDDSPIAKWFSHSVSGLQLAGVLPEAEAAYAIMIRKGNDKLRAEINRALEDVDDDGSRQSLLVKWFADGSTEVN
jgi:ABC-type amino acid transport substrate-binding protein